MPPHARPVARNRALRLLIVDAHEVSRAACAALLRTEGMHVVADVALGGDAVAATRELAPDVVLVDAAPGSEDVFETVRRLRALPVATKVVLTSSAEHSRLDPRLAAVPFLAKADVCKQAILCAAAQGRDEMRHKAESE